MCKLIPMNKLPGLFRCIIFLPTLLKLLVVITAGSNPSTKITCF